MKKLMIFDDGNKLVNLKSKSTHQDAAEGSAILKPGGEKGGAPSGLNGPIQNEPSEVPHPVVTRICCHLS